MRNEAKNKNDWMRKAHAVPSVFFVRGGTEKLIRKPWPRFSLFFRMDMDAHFTLHTHSIASGGYTKWFLYLNEYQNKHNSRYLKWTHKINRMTTDKRKYLQIDDVLNRQSSARPTRMRFSAFAQPAEWSKRVWVLYIFEKAYDLFNLIGIFLYTHY